MSEPLLVLDDVRTTLRGSHGIVRAVDGVSLALDAGETLAIVGESGSGKSILARTVMNLLPPGGSIRGSVRFEGRELVGASERELQELRGSALALSFQDSMTSLNPVRKIGAQLTDPLRRHLGLSRSEAVQRAIEALDRVRIPDSARRLGQYPHELSGGMRQRVMIAIALACRPRLLIADEPTTALDVTVQKEILDLLDRLQHELGMAMILISHDLDVVRDRTSRIAVMYGGQLMELAPTEQLFARPAHPYSAALIAATPAATLPAGGRFATIPGHPPSLVSPPAGCPFAPRCARATDLCRSERPGPHGPTAAACFFPLNAADPGATVAADGVADEDAA